MEQSDLLSHMLMVLSRLKVPYFVTGSIASGYFGEPRFTNDIDVVADLNSSTIQPFCEAFPPPEFYVSDIAARSALGGGQFNVIQPDTGFKIDVMVPRPNAFNASRFARRLAIHDGRVEGWFASPEDIILKKLEYYKEGESEKHLRDITGILKLCREPIDRDYIEKWAGELGVLEIWQAVLKRLEMQ